MTHAEHKLMVIMFARVNEAIGIITETLKSRGLWTGDDEKAFGHAVHADDAKLVGYVAEAWVTYQKAAQSVGVATGQES